MNQKQLTKEMELLNKLWEHYCIIGLQNRTRQQNQLFSLIGERMAVADYELSGITSPNCRTYITDDLKKLARN